MQNGSHTGQTKSNNLWHMIMKIVVNFSDTHWKILISRRFFGQMKRHFRWMGLFNHFEDQFGLILPKNVLFEKRLHSLSVTVWAGFGNDIVVPPYFFNKTVNGQRYLNMLNEHILPFLRKKENTIYYLSAGWCATPYRQPGEGILDTPFQSQCHVVALITNGLLILGVC